MDYHFWLEVGIAAGTLLSLLLHRSHNKKLNEAGDAIDRIETLAGGLIAKGEEKK